MNIHKQTRLWRTKDGRKIRVCDMDSNHLSHTINMLRRTAEFELLEMGRFTQFLQGEMAQYFAEQDYDRLLSMCQEELCEYIHGDIYEALVEEHKRREVSFSEMME